MAKMAAPAIDSKKSLKTIKIFFSRTGRPMILKLGMNHQGEELYKVYIDYDPGMTLTYFPARSAYVANAFDWGKL